MKSLSIALKDLRLQLRDRGTWIDLFLVPLIFIVVWSGGLEGLAAGDADDRIPLPVVNLDEGSVLSQQFLNAVDEAGGVQIEPYDQAEAQQLLEDAEIDRVLTIPNDFNDDVQNGRQAVLQLVSQPDANRSETEAVNLVVQGVTQDMLLKSQLFASLQQMGEMQAAAPSESQAFTTERIISQAQSQWEASSGRPLITVKQTNAGKSDSEEEETPLVPLSVAVPGLTILFVFVVSQKTAASIFEEKRIGSFRRLLAAPMRKSSLLFGKMFPNFITVLLQIVIIFAVAVFVLPLTGLEAMNLGDDPLALVLLSILVALCSTSLGLVIASIAHSENQIGGLSTLFLWGMGLLGGSLIPSFLMPDFLKGLSNLVPHSWAINAYHTLFVFGGGLKDISTDLLAILGFTLAFTAFGLWKFDFD